MEKFDRSEQPVKIVTTKQYQPIPLSYREELKKLGFKQLEYVSKWILEYKGYYIVTNELHSNRTAIRVSLVRQGLIRKITKSSLLDKPLDSKTVFTINQMLDAIKTYMKQIDNMRKDPYDRDSIFAELNKINDNESLREERKILGESVDFKKLNEETNFEKLVKAFPELALDDNADMDESMVKESDTLEDEVREVLAETPDVDYNLFDHNDYMEVQFITENAMKAVENLEKHFKVTPATYDADDCYHISRK